MSSKDHRKMTEEELKEIKSRAMQFCNRAISEGSPEAVEESLRCFEIAGKEDTTGYYFLGNLYRPKVNAPFPDDYERAAEYFKMVSPDTGEMYGKACEALGHYYRKEKQDPVRASVYYALAYRRCPDNRQYKNYYDLAFSKVRDRKVWAACIEKIRDQSDVETAIAKTMRSLEVRCPKCGSTDVSSLTVFDNMKKIVNFRIGSSLKKTSKHCNSCRYEW